MDALSAAFVRLTRFLFERLAAFLFPGSQPIHNARFAKGTELHRLTRAGVRAKTPSLLLGEDRSGKILRVSSTAKRPELGNVLAVAPTRGGKGLLAVSQLLTWEGSAVVNDIKGDLFTQTAGARSRSGRVLVFDPS